MKRRNLPAQRHVHERPLLLLVAVMRSGCRRGGFWPADIAHILVRARECLEPDFAPGLPIHRLDLQLQRRFPLWGRARIDAIVALFNVLNHANYGSYNLNEVSSSFGQPVQDLNNAYQPRRAQIGFRMQF